ncbi:MAG: hypothetical protein AB8F74_07435 [Saprospiraceae bacterium]
MKPFFLFLSLIILCSSCTNDQLPEPVEADCPTVITYDVEIKPIIDNSCAYSGCHVSGFGSGDFTNYASLEGLLTAGTFENRVIIERNMPPSYAPDDKPKMLTDEELDLMKCWMEGGYPEN